MEQVGLVTKIKGDMAQVKVKRVTACGDSCDSCSGTCNIPGVTVIIPNTLNARVGDYIEIKTKTQEGILKYALIMYMIPFSMLLIGIFTSMYIFKSMGLSNYEIYSFLIGAIFLAISYGILKKVDKKVAKTGKLDLEMVRIL